MKKHLTFLLAALLMLSAIPGRAADDIVKKGLSFGPLPIVAYDQDKGLQYGALLNIYKVNVGYEQELVERYDVQASPTLIFFRDGEEVSRLRGMTQKAKIIEEFEKL